MASFIDFLSTLTINLHKILRLNNIQCIKTKKITYIYICIYFQKIFDHSKSIQESDLFSFLRYEKMII